VQITKKQVAIGFTNFPEIAVVVEFGHGRSHVRTQERPANCLDTTTLLAPFL